MTRRSTGATGSTGSTRWLAVCLLLALGACTSSPAPETRPAPTGAETAETKLPVPHERLVGTWEGEAEALFGQKLPVLLHLREDGGELSATIDSPSQDQMGVPVTKIAIDGLAVALEVEKLKGTFEGTLAIPEEGDGSESVSGTWRQHGLSFPMALERTSTEPIR